MSLDIGYLLPTRESIMEGRPEAAPLLARVHAEGPIDEAFAPTAEELEEKFRERGSI